MVISSDFIIGFPGETDDDFAATMKLIDDIGFDSSYSFIYSKRPGTPAADLPDDVSPAIKQTRLLALKEAVDVHVHNISFAMVGTTQRVLVTGVSKKDERVLSGRTDNNRSVHFVGDASLIGQIITVQITAAQTYSLRGELIAS
jgi:tRNA-2-methylthio-N6-dimethylallyladenosine synthase